MTLGLKWAYNPHDVYKTTKTIVQTLVSVVATGGSLLLDVGPMPTGELPPVALQRMAETGEWMAANSEAIYDTTPQSPYAISVTGPAPAGVHGDFSLDWRLTRKADAVYAMLLLDNSTLPAGMGHLALPCAVNVPGGVDGTWPYNALKAVTLLGSVGGESAVPFAWSDAEGLVLTVSKPGMQVAAPYAAVFKLDFSSA
jgi:hypothetical protein